jgi:hypothetical protein
MNVKMNLNLYNMKTRSLFLIIVLILFFPSVLLSQKSDFSGSWKLDRNKSSVDGNSLFLAHITIKLKPDTLLTTRVYENGNGEQFPFDENISLDGRDCKIVIYDMPRTSSAVYSPKDGTIAIASKTTINGGAEDMIAKELWKIDESGKLLTLEFVNTTSGNDVTGKYTFEKEKSN